MTPDLQRLADVIDAHPSSSGTARAVLDVNDLLDAIVESLGIVAVSVNGAQAHSLDAAGRFFHTVTIESGQNCFEVVAIDASSGECDKTLCLVGVEPDEGDFSQFSDTTTAVEVAYSNSTFNRNQGTFVTYVQAENTGDRTIEDPLLMVVENITELSITVANPDGFTAEGKPYFVFQSDNGQPGLEPGQNTLAKPLVFHDPGQLAVAFTLSWLALANNPPFFTSVPTASGVVDVMYRYVVVAKDPEDHPVTYGLETAPTGLTLDTATGLVTWTPDGQQVGTHEVGLMATDSRGEQTRQRFTIQIASEVANRPPFFTSSPITQASVGAPYAYLATAFDPDDIDGNNLTFSKLEGPAELVVETDGSTSWDLALPCDCTVGIRVADGSGGHADQFFVLTVGDQPSNPHAPTLSGTPSAIAVVDSLYFYQPVGNDPDPDDILQFSLTTPPSGMDIDAATGRVTWIPELAQLGSHSVVLVLDDGNGATASQAWDIEVFDGVPNRPPVIDSIPNLIATIDVLYEYPVTAIDPDGDRVTYEPVAPPSGMNLDPVTGLITWTPTTAGSFTIAIKAVDPVGTFGSQVYELDVHPPNDPPVIVSSPVTEVMVGAAYRYDVGAVDPNSDVVDYFLSDDPDPRPDGMTIDRLTGLILWAPETSQVGTHPVKVLVDDRHGGTDDQPFTIEVLADTDSPQVQIVFAREPACSQEAVDVCVQAADNIGIVNRTLTADEEPLQLDAFGCVSYTPQSPDIVAFEASVGDAAGNIGTDPRNLQVADCQDHDKPVVTITSPAPNTVVTGPVDIIGSITDDTPAALIWEVRIARTDTDEFKIIASGSGEVVEGVIATFDPTLLPNDTYRVQIEGDDGQQTGGIEFQYGVAGEYKLGNFAVTFTDLTIPVAGIPLVVTRRYDSLDTTPGDFGAGWTLGLPGRVSDSAEEAKTGNEFIDLLANQPYTNNTRVYVTRPDGRRVGFTFDPTPLPFPQAFQSTPRFKPDPGVTDTLEAISPTGSATVWNFGTGYVEFFIPYNPRVFEFKTKEGVTYTIDERDGLQLIEDLNGNTITVTPTGLVSSLGPTLALVRDKQGRITDIIEPQPVPALTSKSVRDEPGRITDIRNPQPVPAPISKARGSTASLHYDYDEDGNLIRFTDQSQNETEYFYDNPQFLNHLTRIHDQLGRPLIRNVYDTAGRLIAQCGPDGDVVTLENCFELINDTVANVQTIINPRGYRSDLFLDERGNVTIERRFLENGVDFVDRVMLHDENNNPLVVTDPAGTTLYTYDDDGQLLTRTDPDGKVSTFSRNSCGLIASTTDTTGNIMEYTYDENCNLRFVNDALGHSIEMQYDDGGNVTDFFDAAGGHWQFTYDIFGFQETAVDPLGNVEETHFDSIGELQWQIDRNGRRIDYTYDENHRIDTATWDTMPPTLSSHDYNAAGFPTSIVSPDATVTMEYWDTGLLKSVDNLGTPGVPNVVVTYGYYEGGELKPGYDGNGNITHVMDSLGGMTEYVYDALDRLTAVKQYTAPQPNRLRGSDVDEKSVEAVYDANGILSEVRRYADLAKTQGVVNTTYGYECPGCVGRLTSIQHRKAIDVSVVHDQNFTLDPFGYVTELSDAEGTHFYSYDGNGRLITVDHPGGSGQPDEFYSYDPTGNRLSSHLSAAYTYSYMLGYGGQRLSQDDQFDYEYDAIGNLTLQTDRATGDYLEYTYDYLDRLTRIDRFDSLATPLGYSEWRYDPFGRRIRADESGTVSCFIYDDENAILKLSDTGVIQGRRFYGLSIDDLVAEDVGGQTRWYLNDGVGTARDLVLDDASVAKHYVYDSFGQILSETNPGTSNDITFTGREVVPDDDLMFFRARAYDPRLGRFTQEDPYSPFQYEYAYDNPLYYYDPLGLQAVAEYRPIISGAVMWVYIGCEGTKVVYVGITGSWNRRVRQHVGRSFIPCRVLSTNSLDDAKAYEQAYMNAFGGAKSQGGKILRNKIRSIALNDPLSNRVKGALARLGGGPAAVAAAAALCLVCP